MRGFGRRTPEDRRGGDADGGLAIAPFSARLVCANYVDRGIAIATGVSGWTDVVGTRDFTQATTTKQPAYGTFGAKPALSFDNVNDAMSSPTVVLSPYAAITVCVSAYVDTTDAGGNMLYETSADPNVNLGAFYLYNQAAGQCQWAFKKTSAGLTSVTFNVTTGIHRFIGVMNTSGTFITRNYLDGVSTTTGGAADTAFGDYVHWIGARNGTIVPFNGKLGDMLIYGDALSVAEIGVVDAFLASRAV